MARSKKAPKRKRWTGRHTIAGHAVSVAKIPWGEGYLAVVGDATLVAATARNAYDTAKAWIQMQGHLRGNTSTALDEAQDLFGAGLYEKAEKKLKQAVKGLTDHEDLTRAAFLREQLRYLNPGFLEAGVKSNPTEAETAAIGAGAGALLLGPVGALAGGYLGVREGKKRKKKATKARTPNPKKKGSATMRRLMRGT